MAMDDDVEGERPSWQRRVEPSRPGDELVVPALRFVGEQDGPPERELKARLVEVFRLDSRVARAYLARVEYGDGSGMHIALCLSSSFAGFDQALVREIGGVFASLFGSHEHLDTVFLREEQEETLTQVCRAFYPTA